MPPWPSAELHAPILNLCREMNGPQTVKFLGKKALHAGWIVN